MATQPTRPETRLARRGGAVELLRIPAALFGLAAGLRARLHDRGWLPRAHLGVPVVCIGNLTVGGTGKTPMVAWVVRALAERGLRAGLLSRGYGGDASGRNDEALELERTRVDVVVMDDGFQHRRLARDLDLVLVDATRPWGLPRPPGGGPPVRAFLPRGFLREAPTALARADAVVITRSDQVSAAELEALRTELEELAPGRPVAETAHRATALRPFAGGSGAPEELAGLEVDLVSGIGNPEAFEATVRALGGRVREHRRFADHHAYSAADLEGLGGSRPLVTTAKDAVKLGDLPTSMHDGRVLEIELTVVEGAAPLEALLDALQPGLATRTRRAIHEGLHG